MMPRGLSLILILLLLVFSCAQEGEEIEQSEGFRNEEDINILPDDRQLIAFERVTDPIRFLPFDLEEMYGDSAELYWRYDLRTMVRADYKDLEFQNQFVAELFKFPDPNTAFGLYSMIRPAGCDVIEIGTEAFSDSNHLIFLKDRYIADIAGFETAPDMDDKIMKLAEAVEARIPGPAQFPEQLSVFPADNKIPCSESYVHMYFLKQPYYNMVFTCDYYLASGDVTAFYISKNGPQALKKYLDFIRYEGEVRKSAEVSGCLAYAVFDPEFGDLCLYLCGDNLLGLINKNAPSIPLDYGVDFIRHLRGYQSH